jgi:hypothetical protein
MQAIFFCLQLEIIFIYLFVFSQNFNMQQIIHSYFQSQTINSHHTSLVKGSLVHFVTLKKEKKNKPMVKS